MFWECEFFFHESNSPGPAFQRIREFSQDRDKPEKLLEAGEFVAGGMISSAIPQPVFHALQLPLFFRQDSKASHDFSNQLIIFGRQLFRLNFSTTEDGHQDQNQDHQSGRLLAQSESGGQSFEVALELTRGTIELVEAKIPFIGRQQMRRILH